VNKIPIIDIKGMNKIFPGVHALKDVDFNLYEGEVHALVGENGAGKSTLIKIISGAYDFTDGQYFVNGEDARIYKTEDAIQKGISVIYQELNNVTTLSIAENIFFGRLPAKHGRVLWKQLYENSQKYMDMVGLTMSPKMKVQYLSIAQQQLVEIAKAISLQAKVIVMDEPTSALSCKEIEGLFKVVARLKSENVAIMYVSHKLEEIFAISDRITVFRDGQNVDTMNTNEIDQQVLIEKMVGRKMSDMFPVRLPNIGEVVLEVEGLTTAKVNDITFNVRSGEIVGFSGLMGAGRTEMTMGLFGADRRITGSVRMCGVEVNKNSSYACNKAGMGYLVENRRDFGNMPNLSVKKNMTIVSLNQISKAFYLFPKKEKDLAAKMIEKLNIKTPSMDQLIPKLSGGNQQKVLLARWLIKQNIKLLIIDEPTRGIDVGAKAEIYSLIEELARQGLAILMVSSELPEILGMCDRVFVMKNGSIVGEFDCDEANEVTLLERAIN